jgi:hypothetical protein
MAVYCKVSEELLNGNEKEHEVGEAVLSLES